MGFLKCNSSLALPALTMSAKSSEEILLTNGNIHCGIPAEELMNEEYILQPGISLDISIFLSE